MTKQMKQKTKGFTLIELLIVIAIIAIIAAVVFVALDPLTRFRDARDSRRWSDVSALLTAIKVDQVDNGGQYISAIQNASVDTYYNIGTGTAGCNSTAITDYCDVDATSTDACIDLSGLVTEGYLGKIPISPNGDGSWAASSTGYVLRKKSNGTIEITACESENTDSISVTR